MALILNIDSAIDTASVCLTRDGKKVAFRKHGEQKEHAAFIHLAIKEVMDEAATELKHIDAIAITSGPGSYTGLRVAMAAAKGLCYALSKPLIAVNTLEVMASAAINTFGSYSLYCPMIDARRMEVFAGIYNWDLKPVMEPQPVVLDQTSFSHYLNNGEVLFFGNGSSKFQEMTDRAQYKFERLEHSATDLGEVAEQYFLQKKFADLSYSEPEYLKNVYFVAK